MKRSTFQMQEKSPKVRRWTQFSNASCQLWLCYSRDYLPKIMDAFTCCTELKMYITFNFGLPYYILRFVSVILKLKFCHSNVSLYSWNATLSCKYSGHILDTIRASIFLITLVVLHSSLLSWSVVHQGPLWGLWACFPLHSFEHELIDCVFQCCYIRMVSYPVNR